MNTIRPVWADVDLAAIRHNVALIREATGVAVCAVVKADGYGHGAVPVAAAALEAGAERLAVALVEEAAELREAGITGPIHLLSQPPIAAVGDIVRLRLTPTVYTESFIAALSGTGLAVHLKVDTGMHRVGAAPRDVAALADAVRRAGLHLEGLWTHLAVSEVDGSADTARQLAVFADVVASLPERPPLLHAANSGGALGVPASRFDMVRAGIAVYGIRPSPCFGADPGLRPALALRARVSYVKRLAAGERLSYGLTYRVASDATIATVPLGYADGYSRRLSNRAQAVVRGRRVPVAGTVTMDQILLDCGDLEVAEGDEVELIGPTVTADEIAGHLGTIAYEVLCAISRRVPRVYRG